MKHFQSELEAMSNIEINELVAMSDDRFTNVCILKIGDGYNVGVHDESGLPTMVDYCNNPSDAWPIIDENKIDIQFGSEEATNGAESFKWDGVDILSAWLAMHDNPLRAAMIVFLLMQQDKESNQ